MHSTSDSVGNTSATKIALVVDDIECVRLFHAHILKKLGFEFKVAGDGEEAWRMLNADRFDLLVMDIVMPKLDGIALIDKMRASPDLAGLPVLVVTKDEMGEKVKRLQFGYKGPFAMAIKPIHPKTIRDKIRHLFGAEIPKGRRPKV